VPADVLEERFLRRKLPLVMNAGTSPDSTGQNQSIARRQAVETALASAFALVLISATGYEGSSGSWSRRLSSILAYSPSLFISRLIGDNQWQFPPQEPLLEHIRWH
jgi:hypothetical protein